MTRTAESPVWSALETETRHVEYRSDSTESAGAEDRLAILRPVGSLHLDLARLRQHAFAAAIRVEHARPRAVLSRVVAPREREPRAVRRPQRLDESPVRARQQQPLLPFAHRSFPQLVAAGPDGAIGDLRAVGARVEIHLSRAAVANRIRFAGDAALGRVEWERPQPRSARRRREDQSRAVRRNSDVRLFSRAGRQPFGTIDPFLRHRIDGNAPDVLRIARPPLEIDVPARSAPRRTCPAETPARSCWTRADISGVVGAAGIERHGQES